MSIREAVYVDTSALIPLVVPEVHSRWAKGVLDHRDLLSSVVAKVELARTQHKVAVHGADVYGLSKNLNTVGLNSEVVELAAGIPGPLKSLDAIHVGTWLLLHSSGFTCEFVTADRQLARAAQAAGATVIHPFGDAL